MLAASGLTPESFRVAGKHKVKGARRPLRVRPEDVQLEAGVDDHGAFITIAFTLPAGSFATVLVRELTKSPAPQGPTTEVAADHGSAAGNAEVEEAED